MSVTDRPPLERRLALGLELDTRAKATGLPTIRGIAAPFDTASSDLGGFVEIIRRQAFDGLRSGRDVRALVHHDPSQLLGRTKNEALKLRVAADGLRFTLEPPDTQLGRDVVEQVRRGDLDGVSIGFRVPKDGDKITVVDGRVVRELLAVDLFELSLTAQPAYPGTRVEARVLDEVRAAVDSARDRRASLRRDLERLGHRLRLEAAATVRRRG